MIDFRPIIIQYIKDKTNDIDIFDGSQTFKQPNSDYITYYILTEDKGSFVNGGDYSVNVIDDTLFDNTHDPLTIVTMSIDVRGANSFLNTRNLYNSLDTISNKEILSLNGVSFMALGAISSLPQLKNTFEEEGYLFELTFSYDNTHIEQVAIADKLILNSTVTIKT